jgi:glycine cleavage system H protein
MEINGFNLPDELYYEENHFWLRPQEDLIIMGMDDFARKLAGEIVYVQLPDDGKVLKAGKKFAKIESGKWLGKVYESSPESGWGRYMPHSMENLRRSTKTWKWIPV